jgi:hypothetical protein
MEDWKAAADKETGSADLVHQKLKKAGFKVTREEVREYIASKPKPDSESLKIDLNKHTAKEIIMNKDGTQTSERWVQVYNEEQLKDNEFLLNLHGYDPDEWIVEWAKSTIWQNYSNAEGVTDLYASKITVRRRTGINEKEVFEHFIEQAEKYSPVSPRVIERSGQNMLTINVCDLHVGQLSWGVETGENYDYKIATDRFKDLISDAIAKSPYKDYEKILFVKGNDFFNSDNMQGSTTKGTQQTNDVRPQKMFDKGVDLWVWAVDALRTAFPHSPIETELVPGNHDRLTSYYAAKYLYAWFRKDPSVIIDISPKLHKGLEYGSTALLFTHGEHELKNLDWVYTEFRHLIGSTKTTEIHAGHQHRIKVEEKNGAIIRVNSSPAANGQYSYGEGYNSIAQIISRVYSKEAGLEYEIYSRVGKSI